MVPTIYVLIALGAFGLYRGGAAAVIGAKHVVTHLKPNKKPAKK
jgi:hypothetical protein